MAAINRIREIISDLEKALLCGLCGFILDRPCTLSPCDHAFCHDCLRDIITPCDDDDTNECPVCGAGARHTSTHNQLGEVVDLYRKLDAVVDGGATEDSMSLRDRGELASGSSVMGHTSVKPSMPVPPVAREIVSITTSPESPAAPCLIDQKSRSKHVGDSNHGNNDGDNDDDSDNDDGDNDDEISDNDGDNSEGCDDIEMARLSHASSPDVFSPSQPPARPLKTSSTADMGTHAVASTGDDDTCDGEEWEVIASKLSLPTPVSSSEQQNYRPKNNVPQPSSASSTDRAATIAQPLHNSCDEVAGKHPSRKSGSSRQSSHQDEPKSNVVAAASPVCVSYMASVSHKNTKNIFNDSETDSRGEYDALANVNVSVALGGFETEADLMSVTDVFNATDTSNPNFRRGDALKDKLSRSSSTAIDTNSGSLKEVTTPVKLTLDSQHGATRPPSNNRLSGNLVDAFASPVVIGASPNHSQSYLQRPTEKAVCTSAEFGQEKLSSGLENALKPQVIPSVASCESPILISAVSHYTGENVRISSDALSGAEADVLRSAGSCRGLLSRFRKAGGELIERDELTRLKKGQVECARHSKKTPEHGDSEGEEYMLDEGCIAGSMSHELEESYRHLKPVRGSSNESDLFPIRPTHPGSDLTEAVQEIISGSAIYSSKKSENGEASDSDRFVTPLKKRGNLDISANSLSSFKASLISPLVPSAMSTPSTHCSVVASNSVTTSTAASSKSTSLATTPSSAHFMPSPAVAKTKSSSFNMTPVLGTRAANKVPSSAGSAGSRSSRRSFLYPSSLQNSDSSKKCERTTQGKCSGGDTHEKSKDSVSKMTGKARREAGLLQNAWSDAENRREAGLLQNEWSDAENRLESSSGVSCKGSSGRRSLDVGPSQSQIDSLCLELLPHGDEEEDEIGSDRTSLEPDHTGGSTIRREGNGNHTTANTKRTSSRRPIIEESESSDDEAHQQADTVVDVHRGGETSEEIVGLVEENTGASENLLSDDGLSGRAGTYTIETLSPQDRVQNGVVREDVVLQQDNLSESQTSGGEIEDAISSQLEDVPPEDSVPDRHTYGSTFDSIMNVWGEAKAAPDLTAKGQTSGTNAAISMQNNSYERVLEDCTERDSTHSMADKRTEACTSRVTATVSASLNTTSEKSVRTNVSATNGEISDTAVSADAPLEKGTKAQSVAGNISSVSSSGDKKSLNGAESDAESSEGVISLPPSVAGDVFKAPLHMKPVSKTYRARSNLRTGKARLPNSSGSDLNSTSCSTRGTRSTKADLEKVSVISKTRTRCAPTIVSSGAFKQSGVGNYNIDIVSATGSTKEVSVVEETPLHKGKLGKLVTLSRDVPPSPFTKCAALSVRINKSLSVSQARPKPAAVTKGNSDKAPASGNITRSARSSRVTDNSTTHAADIVIRPDCRGNGKRAGGAATGETAEEVVSEDEDVYTFICTPQSPATARKVAAAAKRKAVRRTRLAAIKNTATSTSCAESGKRAVVGKRRIQTNANALEEINRRWGIEQEKGAEADDTSKEAREVSGSRVIDSTGSKKSVTIVSPSLSPEEASNVSVVGAEGETPTASVATNSPSELSNEQLKVSTDSSRKELRVNVRSSGSKPVTGASDAEPAAVLPKRRGRRSLDDAMIAAAFGEEAGPDVGDSGVSRSKRLKVRASFGKVASRSGKPDALSMHTTSHASLSDKENVLSVQDGIASESTPLLVFKKPHANQDSQSTRSRRSLTKSAGVSGQEEAKVTTPPGTGSVTAGEVSDGSQVSTSDPGPTLSGRRSRNVRASTAVTSGSVTPATPVTGKRGRKKGTTSVTPSPSPSTSAEKRKRGKAAEVDATPPKHGKTTPNTRKGPVKPGDKKNAKGETRLHVACIKGQTPLVRELLAEGANPNVKDNAGWTPLHEASNHGYTEIARLLLTNGAFVNTPGLDNDTPLHDAVENGQVDVARVLVAHGADLSQRNLRGVTPAEKAMNVKMKEALSTQAVIVSPSSSSQNSHIGQGQLTLLASGLPRDSKGKVNKCAALLRAHTVTEFTSAVTHLVVSVNQEGQCPRTIKYLLAVLAGAWIVNLDWADACVTAGAHSDEENYEVPGTSTAPNTHAPRRSRNDAALQKPKLFNGCSFYFSGLFKYPTPPKDELVRLVTAGGGKVLTREPRGDNSNEVTVPYHAPAGSIIAQQSEFVVIESASSLSCQLNSSGSGGGVVHVSPQWLMDCIAHYELRDTGA